MKNKVLFIILFLFCILQIFPKSNPWGDLKKVYLYYSAKNSELSVEQTEILNEKIKVILNRIQFEGVNRSDKKEIVSHLVRFGDYYYAEGEFDLSKAFYKKVLKALPDNWDLYNKLERINRAKGNVLTDLNNIFSQLLLIFKNFHSSFLFVNSFLNTLFFSGILVFFIFSILSFIRYFRLAGNDSLVNEKGVLSVKRVLLVVVILLWPVFLRAGWMIFPFLITGFLWIYLNEYEKKTVSFIMILIVIFSALYSVNLIFERGIEDDRFKTVQKVYNGHLFEKDDYEKFDNELKVIQAFSYFEKNQSDTALEILNSTGEKYKNELKYNLLGNIYYNAGDFSQSIKNYQESLSLNDKSKATFNNFTLALLRNKKPKVFDLWAKRYPQILENRKVVSRIKEAKIPQYYLWKRLLNFPKQKFNLLLFLKNILVEFLKLPIVYYVAIFIFYIIFIKRMFIDLGKSTYCSKCSKVIKEASIHKSYKVCNECYQLFMIKDIIFLEAKILKEKELNKKFRKKYNFSLLFSIIIPGLTLKYRGKSSLFVIFSLIFYFLLGFSIVGIIVFNNTFASPPLFFSLLAFFSFILYLSVNIFSLRGE